MKTLTLMITAAALSLSSPLVAEDPSVEAALACTVSKIDPPHAMFFTPGGFPPQVGDTIDLDLSQSEITDLTFSSGGSVPLKEAGAKLVKKQDPTLTGPHFVYFEGTHRSRTSDYIGVLTGHLGEDRSFVSVELLRKRFFGPMELHKLHLECTQK